MVTEKIRFFPNINQKKIFKKCFAAHRFFYNKTIEIINSNQVKKITLPSLRKLVMKSDKDIINTEDSWQIDIPYDTRQLAIKDAITAYHSCIALKKKGNIKSFKLDFKKRNQNRQIFWVDKSAMKKDWNIFVTRLKNDSKLRFKKRDYKKISKDLPSSDFKILNDNGAYYILLSIPYKAPKIEDKKYEYLSLDPGVRTFQTGYCSNGHTLKIDINYKDIIKKYHDKMDNLKSIRDKSPDKRTRNNLSKKYRKLEKKVRDIIFDMHNKISSKLAKEYECILLPEFNTSGLLRKRNLCSSVKRYINTFSFYKFKEKLKWECNKNKSKIYIVTEEYTSKTCTSCGNIKSNLGSNHIYECKNCGLCIDRDINGARNILLKYLV